MSKVEWKNLSPSSSWLDLAPNNSDRRQTTYGKTYSSAPSSANLVRRKHHLRASLRAPSDIGSEGDGHNIRRDRVAWQIVSQQLTLLLEQKRRLELTNQHRQSILSDKECKDHVHVPIDEIQQVKVKSTSIEGKLNRIESEFLILIL